MRYYLTLLTLSLFIVTAQLTAEVTRVKFPTDLDKLIHYTTVRRGDVTEHIVTDPQTMDAVKKRRPIPAGSRFVLIDRREGKVYRYFVMEKGAGWGNDYDERKRTGDWQYQWFWGDKSVNLKEDTSRCMSCHQAQEGADFLFTANKIPHYAGKPVE